ncbi:MAG: M50 family metallopeptidase [Leptospiraceae bacterium]|nr:M50 family metallopeptidase [Leptospiraceae bacterium]MDW8307130.1 M50 family metallopeptidase [Leptospiraceae bacterium]
MYFWRTIFIVALVVMISQLWDHPYLVPLKIFTVYLHELSHALAALLTGGKVEAIGLGWNESGSVTTRGGIIPLIALAGYLGSMFWGSLMVHLALRNQWTRLVAFLVAILFLALIVIPQPDENPSKGLTHNKVPGLGWGILFGVSALFMPFFARVLIFLLGGVTTIYSLIDLKDFFSGSIMKTDAGLIAQHLVGNTIYGKVLAYLIAGGISFLAIYILFYMISRTLIRPVEPYSDNYDLQEENWKPASDLNSQVSKWRNE